MSLPSQSSSSIEPFQTHLSFWQTWSERIVHGLLAIAAGIPVLGIWALLAIFVYQSSLFFREVPVWQFLTDTTWTPLFLNPDYGIGVLASATLMITAIALIVAVPTGVLAAVYLSEYAHPAARRVFKPTLEALAGVPTIVFGYFALEFVTPKLELIFPTISLFNALSAGIATGLLITPVISSISEDALESVPDVWREGAYAVGLTKREAIATVIIPVALPGIIASVTLATSRCLGETMIASIAAGQRPALTLNPLETVSSITSFIIQVSLGAIPSDSLIFHTIFTLGMVLFLITLLLNQVGQWLVRHHLNRMIGFSVPSVEVETTTVHTPSSLPKPQVPHAPTPVEFQPRIQVRQWQDFGIMGLGTAASLAGIVTFSLLLLSVCRDGFSQLDWQFLTSFTSRNVDQAGIYAALVGTIWILVLTAVLAFPVGIGAAIYLEVYLPDNALNRWIELNISNSAAVPSILYGLLGLSLLVRQIGEVTGGRSILSAAVVTTIIALPLLIIAARSAIRTVPEHLCQAGYAVGMTRWQMVRQIILPDAAPGIVTGMLLALSRIIGETSPLIAVGALAYVTFIPPLSLEGLRNPVVTLPTQIFFWALRPEEAFRTNAAAAIIVLGVMVLLINISAVLLRDRYRRHRH